MKHTLIAVLIFSSLAMAQNKDWEKTIFVDNCGHSEGEVKAKLKDAAQNEANFYLSICDGDKGTFSTNWGKYRCETDPQDFTCPVVCSLSGTAVCRF